MPDQVFHEPGEVMHHIGIILFRLQLRQFRILKLLDRQHFSCPADMGVMENVTDLSQNHLRRCIGSQCRFILRSFVLIPIRLCKDGMLHILLQNILHKCIQNRLLVLKMAVK